MSEIDPEAGALDTDLDEDLVGSQRSWLVHFEHLHLAAERADSRYKHVRSVFCTGACRSAA